MTDAIIKKRWYFEYAVLRLMAAAVRTLPYKASILVGFTIALPLYLALYSRVREAHRRIRIVYGETLSDRRVRQVAWISFRNTIFSAIEMMRFPVTRLKWVNRVFDFGDSVKGFMDHAATGRGAVIAVPHMGSWELAGIATFLSGVPLFNFSGQQRNIFINNYMNYLRAAPGIDFVPRGSSVYRQAIRLLKSGRFCAIMPDVRMRKGGIPVKFFGSTANIGTGSAFFAKMADVPIFPCIIRRKGWFKHSMTSLPPIWPDNNLDKDEDVKRMTVSLLELMEKEITSEPEQWFWYNRRWILDPIDK